MSETGKRVRVATQEGPVDAFFSTSVVADIATGTLVEVEGRLEGMDAAMPVGKRQPRRMQARLIKVLKPW